MDQEFYIYKITCSSTNLSYVGQTKRLKYKNNIPYNYGITGRWCDHVSSSKRTETPLANAIRRYGPDSFKIELLETATEQTADDREAYWIGACNSVVPNGYNVMSHSRCKHRQSTTIEDNYIKTATGVELKVIKKHDIPHLVYVYVDIPTERKRFVFGQTHNSEFENTLAEANSFVSKFTSQGIPLKSSDKLDSYRNKTILRIRVAKFNKTMVAIYIKTTEGQHRICFGGKTLTYDKALENANEFIRRLNLEPNLISRQQVATMDDEANSSVGK